MRRTLLVHLSFVLAMSWWVVGCAGRAGDGSLQPPRDAPPWEDVLSRAFDDSLTEEPVNLTGRAPHDVLDQRLFVERLGLSSLVCLADVDQVWARGRRTGDDRQFLDLRIERVLLGELPDDADPIQTVEVVADDELSGALQGASVIFFVRWAPDHDPPFHHHLLVATDEVVAWIEAAVDQARAAGAITIGGKASTKRAQRRARRKAKRAERRRRRSEKRGGGASAPEGTP
ncbi:MAG: hypothetical protein D6705_03840 [Deltaproteobacteria bacterium]|nr:MAG: hypothetical protein D6705_03840 [Deltaproteobacteria bacterium]